MLNSPALTVRPPATVLLPPRVRVPPPIAVKAPLPLMAPLSVRLYPLLLAVTVTPDTALKLLPKLTAAAACKVPLAVTLTSPAPSALLLPTCKVPPPLKVVPTVPAAGP